MDENEVKSFLPNLSVNRPITVIMALIAVLVVGVIAYNKIKIEMFPPGFTPPFLMVNIPYRNANPIEIEQQITRPVEEILQTVRNIKDIDSQSGSNGSFIWMMFRQDADMQLAYSQVRDRVERVRPDLPDDVERIYVRKFDNTDEPILYFGITFEEEIPDSYYLVENFVKKPLERVDGVAAVEIWGLDEKMILIDLDQERMKALKIDIYPVIQELQRDNFAMPSGYLKEGGKKIYVRSLGKFSTLADIENLQIKGTDILLKDVATIRYDVPEVKWIQRIDRKKSVRIGVQKESMANTVDISEEMLRVLEEEIKTNRQLENMTFTVFFDQGSFITDAIDNLQDAGLWGGLFAFLILLYFLRRARMTMLITLAIPLSIVITVITMYFIGWSLNLFTLMGMMVCVGLVVDNSIVIVENIYRRRLMGDSPMVASIRGASEVSLAITMATLTTVVVFLPLILMSDNSGMRFYMLRIGLPIITALIGSLIVALIFIPLIANKLPIKGKIKESRLLNWGRNRYSQMLGWILTHKFDGVVIGLLILTSIQFPAENMKKADNNNGNIGDFRIFTEMPDSYTLEDADRVFLSLEDFMDSKRETYNIKTIDARFGKSDGNLRVYLNPMKNNQWWYVFYRDMRKKAGFPVDNVLTMEEILEEVIDEVPKFPGVEMRTQWWDDGSGEKAITVNIYGRDTATLRPLAEEVGRRLATIPEFLNIETDLQKLGNEVHLSIDRELAKKYGVSPQTIAGLVSYIVRGIDLPDYRSAEKEIDIRAQLKKEDRETLHQLKAMTITTPSGRDIPLSTFVKFDIEKGLGTINRTNGRTYLAVKGYMAEDDVEKVYEKIDEVMAGFDMPRGYSWGKGNRWAQMMEQDEAQQFAMILAVTFVFILMGVLFESFVLPMSILVCIPFSFFGAFWMLYLTGTPLDIMALIGLIILIGVVVNNAIVLVDLINRNRIAGMERQAAIIEAGTSRFRPILMTAFTTIFGLVPMALGNTSLIGIPYAPMGRVIIGGLLTSTFFTLIFVPLTYLYFDDLRTAIQAFTVRLIRKKRSANVPFDQPTAVQTSELSE